MALAQRKVKVRVTCHNYRADCLKVGKRGYRQHYQREQRRKAFKGNRLAT